MRMRIIPCLLFIAGCFISSIKSELFRSGGGGGEQQHPMDNALERDILDKTVDLISKRAYYYATSGPGKRLPNYDFGLGKRSKPFNFGLGKRAEESMEVEYDNYDVFPFRFAYMDDPQQQQQQDSIKRSRPYRFGLGKRDSKEPQRRSSNSRYNFGLGKR